MLPLHQTLSFPYFRQHWSRTALIVASIALGVATLVATRALTASMTLAVGQSVTPLAGSSDLLVSNGEQGVHTDVLRDLLAARLPGVKTIQPLLIDRVALPELGNRTALLIGVDIQAEALAGNPRGIRLEFLEFFEVPRSLEEIQKRFMELQGVERIGVVCVGRELARSMKGDVIRVRVAGKEWGLVKAGTIDAEGPAAALGGSVLGMRLQDAMDVRGQPNILTRIDLTLDASADREAVRQRVAGVLAERADVRTPEANTDMIKGVTGSLELGFSLGGVGALVVGLFLVYNALAVSVAERRHDIGILRSLGATRGQVAALFAGESAFLGLVGACIGVPVGLMLARVSLGPIQKVMSDVFLPLAEVELPIAWDNIVLSMLAGVGVALLAALVPSIQAASEEPADTVRRVPFRPSWIYRAIQAGGSGLIMLAGLGLIAVRGWFSEPRIGTFGGLILVLTGTLLATPFLAAVAARLLGPPIRGLLGLEGRLAADNLARSPGRTGLVIAALAAGVALLLQTAGLTLSSKTAVRQWVDDTMSADLYVFANSAFGGVGESRPMDESFCQRLAALPEVEAAPGVRFQRINYGKNQIYLTAVDANAYFTAEQKRGRTGRQLYPRLLEPDTAIISDNFVLLHRVPVGQTVTLRGPRGPLDFHSIGSMPNYSWNQGTVVIDREQYKSKFNDRQVDRIDLYLHSASLREPVREAILRRWGADKDGLVAMTNQEMKEAVDAVIGRLYGMFYAQNLVIGLVAALGVVMALLISVLQRRRELGLLRAVGASQAQVLRSVLVEAALMGLIGAAIGLMVGIPLEWYVVRVILLEETGFNFPMRIPWAEAGLVSGLAFVTATLAGLGPAVHAMRIRIAEAVAYE